MFNNYYLIKFYDLKNFFIIIYKKQKNIYFFSVIYIHGI